jgi:hypothetical protein
MCPRTCPKIDGARAAQAFAPRVITLTIVGVFLGTGLVAPIHILVQQSDPTFAIDSKVTILICTSGFEQQDAGLFAGVCEACCNSAPSWTAYDANRKSVTCYIAKYDMEPTKLYLPPTITKSYREEVILDYFKSSPVVLLSSTQQERQDQQRKLWWECVGGM